MFLRALALTAVAVGLTVPLSAQPNRQSPAGTLSEAQRAAWGRPGSTIYRIADENVRFSGGQLLQTRFGPVLVAEGKVEAFSHISPGRIGVFYLRRAGRTFARGRAFESAVTGGSFGRIAEWRVSDAFGPNPVIHAEGGSSGQGVTCGYSTLTELTPAGPVAIAGFQSYYDNMNVKGREVTGKIANIVRGRSFDVVFTGDRPGRDRYVFSRGKYRLQSGKPRIDNC